ncbi:hypothetical protein SAMD00019534_037370 [Acytostelium subglobosum LB1]|uniref:hypothetical protein n=1 Tax=Acytostelium subglobosum LB1 TaxID=1410327 RepID=UPI0006448ACF|nr:hypothetical protein SAMD00019534_037370 [Acytostelium subglobosum LB1]GAM20562.1 hypothetical protein SAMD00019534_037370 [Acytostelium subglobosum LB1]|eukprot:XP_012760083.1 hypothetical protein SAMD00019534_037370 [Acytostelium subglobosum LB1]
MILLLTGAPYIVSSACIPLLCTLCDALGVCLLNKPITLLDPTALKDVTLTSILTLSNVLSISGNLLCDGQINLLNGVLKVDKAVTITDLCIINVTGAATVNFASGVAFNKLTLIFNPTADGSPSILTWYGDVNATNLNLTSIGSSTPPKLIFNSDKITIANANAGKSIAYLEHNQGSRLALSSALQVDQMVLNQMTAEIPLALAINNLTVTASTVSALTGTLASLTLRQSSLCKLNTGPTITNLISRDSKLVVSSTILVDTLQAVGTQLNISVGGSLAVGNLASTITNTTILLNTGVIKSLKGVVTSGALNIDSTSSAQIDAASLTDCAINVKGILGLSGNSRITGNQLMQVVGGGLLLTDTASLKNIALAINGGMVSANSSATLTNVATTLKLNSTLDIKTGAQMLASVLTVEAGLVSVVGSISGSNLTLSNLGTLSMPLGGLISTSTINLSGALNLLTGASIAGSNIISKVGSIITATGSIANTPIDVSGTLIINAGALVSDVANLAIRPDAVANASGSITNSALFLYGGALTLATGGSIGSSNVSVSSGVLTLLGGGSLVGASSVSVATGALLNILHGTVSDSVLSLSGTANIVKGSLNNSPVNILLGGLMSLDAESVIQSGALAITGRVSLTGASVLSNCTLLALSGALNVTSNSAIRKSTLELIGSLTMDGASIIGSTMTLLESSEASCVLTNITQTPVNINKGANLLLKNSLLTNAALAISGTVNTMTNVAMVAATSPVRILSKGVLDVSGHLLLDVTSTVSKAVTLVDGVADGLLSLARDAVVTVGSLTDVVYTLDTSLQSLDIASTLQCVGTLQLTDKIPTLNLLSVVTNSLLLGTTNALLNNTVLKLGSQLALTTLGLLSVTNSVVSLTTNTVSGVTNDIVIGSASVTLNNVKVLLDDSVFLPQRLVLDNISSVVNATNLTPGPIGQSTFQYLCDDKIIVLKFSNCSDFECPGSGVCTASADQCPDTLGNCTNIGYPFKCWSGACTASISQCAAMPPCPTNTLRCSDSSCGASIDLCPNNTVTEPFSFYGCPIGYYQCDTGHCQRDVLDCRNFTTRVATMDIPVHSRSPVDSSKDLILPIISAQLGLPQLNEIYGYINVPANFMSGSIQQYISVYPVADSVLNNVNGSGIWGDLTFRDSVKTMVFNATLGNFASPVFDYPIEFQLKSGNHNDEEMRNMTLGNVRMAFINVTEQAWQMMDKLYICKDGRSVCGKTTHFTSFAVLTDYSGKDGNSKDGSSNGGMDKTKLYTIVFSVVGAVVVCGLAFGFVIAKVTNHGNLRYWWASRKRSLSLVDIELKDKD